MKSRFIIRMCFIILCFIIFVLAGNRASEKEVQFIIPTKEAETEKPIETVNEVVEPEKPIESVDKPAESAKSIESMDEPSEPVMESHTIQRVNHLKREELEHNSKILRNLLEFQLLAKKYQNKIECLQSTELLMASFLRSGTEQYTDEDWNTLAGNVEGFEIFIKESKNPESAYFLRKTEYFYDPATGEKIDFIHLMATLNVYLYQDMLYQIYPESGDIGGWAGDCIQLAKEAKIEQVKSVDLEQFMNDRLGISGKFAMGDILADLDALNIYKSLSLNRDSDFYMVFCKYYDSLGEFTRYQSFLTNRFPAAKTEEQLKIEIHNVVAAELSIALSMVCQKEDLMEKEDLAYRNMAGYCFAEYLWKHR